MSLRLSTRQRWSVDATLAVVLASGVAWLLLDREGAPDDWRVLLRNDARLHAAAALLLFYLGGMLWVLHLRRAWRSGRNRVAGVATASLLALLGVTGYLLQYGAGDELHAAIARLHWIIGLGGALAYIVHRVRGPRTRR